MRKIAMPCALLLTSLFTSASLRAQDKIEIFGGYSYARVPVQIFNAIAIGGPIVVTPPGTCPVPVCPPGVGGFFTTSNVNTHGWEVSGAFKPARILGVVADFSGHYGSTHGSNFHLNTYLFGPQVSFPGSVSPFAHFLIGAAHESSGIPIPTVQVAGVNLGANNAFASALGVGIDVKVLPLISLRLIQFDYLLTRFGSQTQNQPRVSAGLVLHF